MPNKLTDAEIKKALEICASEHLGCEDGCPLKEMNCRFEMPKLALDLINRQEEKIEKLRKENDELKNGYFQKRYEETEHQELMGLKEAYRRVDKERDYFQLKSMNLEEDIETANAENESLKAEVEELKETIKVLSEQSHFIRKDGKSPLSLLTEEIKAEAYKEFDELLKEDCLAYPLEKDDITMLVDVQSYNNLLNELVGDGDG